MRRQRQRGDVAMPRRRRRSTTTTTTTTTTRRMALTARTTAATALLLWLATFASTISTVRGQESVVFCRERRKALSLQHKVRILQRDQQRRAASSSSAAAAAAATIDAAGNVDATATATATASEPWEALESKRMIQVHHNGNSKPCGFVTASATTAAALQESLLQLEASIVSTVGSMEKTACPTKGTTGLLDEEEVEWTLNKYEVQALLTTHLATHLQNTNVDTCELTSYCDMGPERTVIGADSNQLVRVPKSNDKDSSTILPCRFYTREGVPINSLTDLAELASSAASDQDEWHLYAVPAGRVFMFAVDHVGEVFHLPHVQEVADYKQPISLQVISTRPVVMEIHNFFNAKEAVQLIQEALEETAEDYKLHRSVTGAQSGAGTIFEKRTSENAWVTTTYLAQKIKRRCFSLLGFDEFLPSHADGLQVLRYNKSTAYIPHMDYLEDKTGTINYDFNSSGKGGNRFATILLYMTDLKEGDGGETVFVHGLPPGVNSPEELPPLTDTIAAMREEYQEQQPGSYVPVAGSWQEEMVAQCRTRLSIRPQKARAVLFYSQFPNGTEDKSSLHGGCPVLKGTKWAANLWVWNAPRESFPNAPRLKVGPPVLPPPPVTRPPDGSIPLTFINSKKDPQLEHAELYYGETTFFGKVGFADGDRNVNTYMGHVWNIKVNGKTLRTYTVDGKQNTFEF